jgi:20S proteasome alpha/beta subunit
LKEGKIDMSVAMGLIGIDGIVLATDSRLTMQEGNITYHEDTSQKLWKLTNEIGLMSTGYNSGYRHFLVDYCNAITLPELNKNIDTLKSSGKLPIDYKLNYLELVNHFAMAIREHVKPFVESYDALRLAGGMDFILAGYDKEEAKIFSIDVYNRATPFVPNICGRYYFSGVKEIGLYWKRKLNLERYNFPITFLKKLAVMIILETIKTHDMIGEPVQLAIIDKDGYHEISNEVENIKLELDLKNTWLYDYLERLGIK